MCHLVTRFGVGLYMKKWLKTVLFHVQNPLISKENLIMDETFIQERIRQLVADSGKSEKRISRDLGRSVGYIQSLTSGKALPSMPMLFQICEYFNIEPKDFFDPNIPCPPTIQKIRSYACHMEKDSLVTLERLSKRLCSTGQSKTNESCDSRNIHEKYNHCKRKS